MRGKEGGREGGRKGGREEGREEDGGTRHMYGVAGRLGEERRERNKSRNRRDGKGKTIRTMQNEIQLLCITNDTFC